MTIRGYAIAIAITCFIPMLLACGGCGGAGGGNKGGAVPGGGNAPEVAIAPTNPTKIPDKGITDPEEPTPNKTNTELDAKTREYQQFAELASMFDGVGVGRATWNYQSMYLERSAPWRAKKLLSLKRTDPVLQKAALRFVGIAELYYTSVQYLDKTNWTPEEMGESIKRLITTLEKDKDNDFPIHTVLDQFKKDKNSKNNNSVFGGTLARLDRQERAVKIELGARILHSRMWAEVLANVKPNGGAENKEFPLRLGDSWVRNVSGKVQTNITIAIKTNSSADFSADDSPYVVFYDQLESGEQINFPFFLINRLWNERERGYSDKKECYKCSIWSDQCRFEDVSFDFKQVPNEVSTYGGFPGDGFAGRYDATAP